MLNKELFKKEIIEDLQEIKEILQEYSQKQSEYSQTSFDNTPEQKVYYTDEGEEMPF